MRDILTINSITALFRYSAENEERLSLAVSGKSGAIAIGGAVWAVLAVAIYLAALYSAFQASFLLNRFADEKKDLSDKIVVLELQLQKRQADFRAMNIPEIESMEKISSIRYIGGETATAYLPATVR